MAKSIAGILVAVMAFAAMALADSAGTGLAQAQTNTSNDRDALVALYNAADGPNWRTATNWLSDRPLRRVARRENRRQWARHRVVPFHDNQLRGEIPPELGSLSNLEVDGPLQATG